MARAYPGLGVDAAARVNMVLTMALAAHLLCGTACGILLVFTGGLMGPFWRRLMGSQAPDSEASAGISLGLRPRRSSPPGKTDNRRPCRFIQLSHNPPPLPA